MALGSLPVPIMTLPEYLKGEDIDDNARPLIEMFAQSSDIYTALPFEGLASPVYLGFLQAALSNKMAFRAINAGSTSGAGVLTPYQEDTYLVDHDIPVDRAIVERGGDRRRAIEEKNAMAELGQLWVQNFIKGNNITTPTVFNGLQQRAAFWGRQIDNSGGTSGGAALSLLQLDKAINNTAKKGKRYLLAPWAMKPYFIQAARNSSLTGFVMQTFGEGGPTGVGGEKVSYAGLDFLWGYEKDLHPPVLQFNEVAPAGGSAVTGSIYVCDFGEEGIMGIQRAPMEIRDMGLLQDGITYNTHVHWDVGLVVGNLFSFTRLCGITEATIVA